ncbi:ABC transporter permease [Chengkuizengella sediminis]|uniref:ABC transporter permease n=1 Tax=Chengkuizengella sediminis TaxID=1885917 RepID=UPI00138949E8|nr:ABC transporter permease [Chengkuizengella sediminis]NDI36401.1 ABC transporter permease [Chengkuizengella sediminis]
MFNLVRNENMKIYKKVQTWVMVGLLLFMQLVMALFVKDSGFTWLTFADLSSYLTSIIAIYAIVVASGIVASEFSNGTIKLLLIRPFSRTKILTSKYIAVLIYIVFLILFNLISSIIIGFLFFGNATSNSEFSLGSILQNYGFTSIELIMTITFSFMISSIFRSSVLSIILSIIIHFFSSTVVSFLSLLNYQFGKYFLYSNTDLRQYLNGNEPKFEGMSLGFSITVLIVYFILFILISQYVFKKRDVVV